MTRRPVFLREKGFTLIELLVTVAVVGVLAAIAIVSFRASLDRARQRQSMANMRGITTAIEAYDTDHSYLPTDGITMAQLANVLAPAVLTTVPERDGWGHSFVYTSPGMSYSLRSFGRDGVLGPANASHLSRDQFDNDILVIDGQFAASPES
jgi:general secretion pathway protein G